MLKQLPELGEELWIIPKRVNAKKTRQRHHSRRIANETRIAATQISEQKWRRLSRLHPVPWSPHCDQRSLVESGCLALPQIFAHLFWKIFERPAIRRKEQSRPATRFELSQRVLSNFIRRHI